MAKWKRKGLMSLCTYVIACQKIKAIDFEALNADMCNSELLNNGNYVDSAVSEYENVLSLLLNKHAPVKQRTIIIRPRAPWYNADITDAKQIQRKLEWKWRLSKLLSYRIAFSNQCKAVNKLNYECKQTYYTSLIQNNATNSKLLFETVNKLLQKNSDQLYSKAVDDKRLANSFADFFATKIKNINLVLKLLSICKTKSCPLDPLLHWYLRNVPTHFCRFIRDLSISL